MLVSPTLWSKMTDYSNELFSFKGSEPTFLPSRIRLPNKTTRSPKDISLEELSACGYVGPVHIPSFENCTECLSWCSESLTYNVVKSSNTEETQTTLKVKKILNNKLCFYKGELTKNITEDFFNFLHKAIAELENLLIKDVLDFSDVPSESFKGYRYKKDAENALKIFFEDHGEESKKYYENFGFIPFFPENLKKYFSVPSNWVKQINPDIEFTSSPYPPNSPVTVALSGYDKLNKTGEYRLTDSKTVPLLFSYVFYPDD